MSEILDSHIPTEGFDVFQVAQIKRVTSLEHLVAVYLFFVTQGKTSDILRHVGTDIVL